jgi:hypothetical protein
MERLRQSLPTCSPAACCESEALDDPLDAGILSELNYGNWMSDVANRLWNIPLVRLAHASGAHTAGGGAARGWGQARQAYESPIHTPGALARATRFCLRHAIHHLRAVPDTRAGEGGRRGSVAPGCAPSCALRPPAPAAELSVRASLGALLHTDSPLPPVSHLPTLLWHSISGASTCRAHTTAPRSSCTTTHWPLRAEHTPTGWAGSIARARR